MSIVAGAFRLQCRRHRRRNRPLASSPTSSATPRSARRRHAYIVDRKGEVLANSARAPRSARNSRALPQVAAVMAPGGVARTSGKDCERPCRADRLERGAEARLARVLRAADRAGAGADPRPTGADRASDRARPRGRDHRRHHHGAAHAGADHRTSRRRPPPRRRRFRPPHRGEDRGRAGRTGRASSTAWPASWPRPIPASKAR